MTYIHPILPLCLAVLLVCGVLRRTWRYSRLVTAITLALLFLWSWPPVAYLVCGTLEWRYPAQLPASDAAHAIVVLSGGTYPRNVSQPEDLPAMSTYERTSYGSWLYKNWRALPILVSGGLEGSASHGVVAADVMRRVLEQQGVPAGMIWSESQSTSTYENALYSAGLLRAKGIHNIVLVTDAMSMLRADKAFRHQGLTVIAAPCCARTQDFTWSWKELIPSTNAINDNETALHEWVGSLWYWLRDRI